MRESASQRSAWFGWALALALAAGVYVGIEPTLGLVKFQAANDEGYYLRYVQALDRGGLTDLPELARAWLARAEDWRFPPPSRVGYLVPASAWCALFGSSFESLARLSLTSLALLVLVQHFFARRHLAPLAAGCATLLLAASPLLLGLGRRALTDAPLALLQISSLWLFLEVLREPRRIGWQVAFCAVFAWSISAKEIAVLLALPMALFAWIERLRGGELSLARAAAVLAVPMASAGVAVLLACGGPERTLELMRVVMNSPSSNDYAIAMGSGPWYRYCVDQLLLSPWTTLLGLAGFAVALWRWRRGEFERLLVFCALVYVLQLAALAPFTKNVRYAAPLEMPLRVSAAALLAAFFGGGLRGRALTLVAVLALAWSDVRDFQRAFVRGRIYDPVTANLLAFRRLIRP